MKKYISLLTTLVVIAVLASCKDDDNASPEEKALKTLAGTWTVIGGGQVIVDGTDHSANYATMSIAFNATDDGQMIYTVKNGGYAFNGINMDTFSFTDANYNSIVRGQDEVIMLFSVTDDRLSLNFTIDDPQAGRVKGVFGEFELKLVRKN